MQQITPVQSAALDTPLPAPQKSTNKTVYPVSATGSDAQLGLLSKTTNSKDGLNNQYAGQQATYNGNADQPGFGFNGTSNGTSSGTTDAQAKAPQQVSQPQPGQMPPKPGTVTNGNENSATVPPGGNPSNPGNPNAQYMVPTQPVAGVDFQGNDYVSDGYTGVQGDSNYSYDPNDKSLVQNQLTGLLDPNSDIMKKAIASAQAYSAARGLQSSSIGNEAALSSMIDKALPIAQQDATTYNQAQTLGWNNNFTSDQSNLTREHDASMSDKQADINNQVQNNQMEWQSDEKVADRQFQTQLADLQYKQQLGTLDKQQELQLVQMEKTASIQTERDAILNKYQVELNNLQNDQRWQELTAQIDSQFELRKMELSHDMQTQYGNSIGDATNAALNAIGLAMNNPSMTKEQQSAAVSEIMNSLNMQTNMLGILYGAIPAPVPGTATGTNTDPATGISNPNVPQIPYTSTTAPGTSVGASGGTSTNNGGSTDAKGQSPYNPYPNQQP